MTIFKTRCFRDQDDSSYFSDVLLHGFGAGRAQRVDRIERIITLDGELSAKQRARLLEIANKCPVFRTLTSTIEIDSRIADA